ncbi:MAG TPA: putative quinol monooxygenase [Rubrivivax sp.]|nr:putative quinol monooxygenase [Rubrivivax sp.]
MSHTNSFPASTAIKKLARITAKPGQASALRDALRELEAATRQEPGCQEFTFFQALSDPEAFVLLETFSGQAALDSHMAMPHTRAFFNAGLVAGVEVVTMN